MPERKIAIVYDGECTFCIDQIERIKTMDRDECFEYIPRQVPDLDERFPVLKDMNFEEGMRLIDNEGRVHVGADAVYQIGKRLPGVKLVAWAYVLPGIKQIVRLGYKWVAANRKRLGRTCENKACRLHHHAAQSEELSAKGRSS